LRDSHAKRVGRGGGSKKKKCHANTSVVKKKKKKGLGKNSGGLETGVHAKGRNCVRTPSSRLLVWGGPRGPRNYSIPLHKSGKPWEIKKNPKKLAKETKIENQMKKGILTKMAGKERALKITWGKRGGRERR